MIGTPKVENRTEQHYMGIRTKATMRQLSKVIPQLLDEICAWLDAKGIEPVDAPLIRYHVIDMAAQLDIELGVPVAAPVQGDGRVSASVLPAGRYAALTYEGSQRGIDANRTLLEWGAAQGLVWDRAKIEQGDAFGGRIERFLTDPAEQPDRNKWQTEVAICLAD